MEDDAQKHRLTNKDKSNKTKLAWKKYHGHYMSGTRKRERREMNQSFYKTCKELDEYVNEALKDINEADITKDNVFDNKISVQFNSIAGGISVSLNDTNGNVSFSTNLEQSGSGQYKLPDWNAESLKTLHTSLKNDLLALCENFDKEIDQILAKNGLKSTK